MRIEILYSEICNLFGDTGNIRYLKNCLPEAEFIFTSLHDRPAFTSGNVDMIYMGPCTESNQLKVIEKLRLYKEDLQRTIDENKVFLFTGNAMEVLFDHIIDDNGEKTEALGIFKLYAKQTIMKRFNSIELCNFNGMEIVGFKTQFTMAYGDNSDFYFAKVERGAGINEKSQLEGVHLNNFFGTYLVGPILVLNPYFMEYIMGLLGEENPKAAFRDEAVAAYNKRLKEFKDPSIKNEH